MKTIIAGSRTGTEYSHLLAAMAQINWTITKVISGGANGADRHGEQWAHNCEKPLEVFPAQWARHGRKAGIIRNIEMAEEAQALIAIWDGKSPGTKHMIETAEKYGLRVFVYRVRASAE